MSRHIREGKEKKRKAADGLLPVKGDQAAAIPESLHQAGAQPADSKIAA
jgi:hypothetical protein